MEPGSDLNVFHGPNAEGKTNFLEAVHLLTTGRSPRTFTDTDMIRNGSDTFFLKAALERPEGTLTVEVIHQSANGKTIRINGNVITNQNMVNRTCPTVYFSPDELRIVSGAPFWRRSFLDQLLSQVSATYHHHWENYRSIVAQRNATLRDLRSRRASDALMAVWDEQLAEHGGELIHQRLQIIEKLNRHLADGYARVAPSERVALSYRSRVSYLPTAGEDAAAAGAQLASALSEARPTERERGHTLVGPHRDDIHIIIDDMEARGYASQGQRRSLVLALKLAASSLVAAEMGIRPVLLLDDVFSELDRTRRRNICSLAEEGYQTLISCTDRATVEELALSRGRFFSVTKGRINPD